jgi:hypothetical protein
MRFSPSSYGNACVKTDIRLPLYTENSDFHKCVRITKNGVFKFMERRRMQ